MSHDVQAKRSHGLTQFVASIRDQGGMSILDLGGISQENVNFITSLGHRLYSEDFLRTLDAVTYDGDAIGGPSQRDRIDGFLQQCLDYGPESLDGALVWDTLQYLSRPLLLSTVERLHQILRPGSYMLTFFHTTERPQEIPVYSFRIANAETLHVLQRGMRPAAQVFNNRGIERLFEGFEAVKFFLTRDNLREVIVKR